MTQVLYVLVRTDLDSMNPGKAMAQVGHAGSAFTYHNMVSSIIDQDVIDWHKQGNGFGTKLTLAVTKKQMETVVMIAKNMGYIADLVLDETYPYIVSNEIADQINIENDAAPRHPINATHMALYRNEYTVGYVFVPNKEEDDIARALLANFKLHP